MYKKYIKRVLDILAALLAIPLLFILFVILAPIIYLTDKGPVLYKAPLRGKNGNIFMMYKFRSMYVNAPDIRNENHSTYNSADDKRVTGIGRVIRKLSFDETAQIINILKGDMSWIGPRASLPVPGYTFEDLNALQQKRLQVLPGITGYSAALYRNSISKEKKYAYDAYYVDHVSLCLDIKIIIWTIRTILFRRNLYTNEEQSDIQKNAG